MSIRTVLNHYRFDLTNAEQAAQYEKLRTETLQKIGFPVWRMYMENSYVADRNTWDFVDMVKKAAGPVTLETDCLFDNQWNSAPMAGITDKGLRLFNWAEGVYANKKIKEGYWLTQTAEMSEVLRNTHKCGYCGKQEAAAKGYTFCPHCLGSEYLTSDMLHLTRMQAVSAEKDRAKLTETERAYLLPLFKDAQIHGSTERDKARIAKMRADIQTKYDKAIKKATAERDGYTVLMDLGLKLDNVIYYDHTGRFSFGWRKPVEAILLSEILDVISEFPFPYEIVCADGRKLEGNIC